MPKTLSPEHWALEKLRAAELLPCPFCGGKAQQLREEGRGLVMCSECGARVLSTTAILAHQLWNMRKK